ncbi:hypothetical protein HPB47_022542 [Ixodes persulcatus]|uniref:Uncharacterized protein n=1 Tax=Ixodes persulcatus TaxID=34615 RepID=A0AC60QAI2_IXOPE|nr:hypothetical protein HPB47_022542 [Ixodes persulcatus]
METEKTTIVTRIVELESQLRRERDERQALEEKLKNVEGSRTETVVLNGNGGQAEKQDDEARSVTSVGDGDGHDDGSVGKSFVGALAKNSQRNRRETNVVNQTGQLAGGSTGAGPSEEKKVLVVGSSNMNRFKAGLVWKVKEDERVTVQAYPGACIGKVTERAKNNSWESMDGQNLVVVRAGLNDVLQGREQKLGRQIEAGVRQLRATAEGVQIVMCTTPEIQGQSVKTERKVVRANAVIRGLGRELGYECCEGKVHIQVVEGLYENFILGKGALECANLVAQQVSPT